MDAYPQSTIYVNRDVQPKPLAAPLSHYQFRVHSTYTDRELSDCEGTHDCMHCGAPVRRPFFYPVRSIISGGFEVAPYIHCQPECALATLLFSLKDQSLRALFNQMYGASIVPAPPREIMFCGSAKVSRAEFQMMIQRGQRVNIEKAYIHAFVGPIYISSAILTEKNQLPQVDIAHVDQINGQLGVQNGPEAGCAAASSSRTSTLTHATLSQTPIAQLLTILPGSTAAHHF